MTPNNVKIVYFKLITYSEIRSSAFLTYSSLIGDSVIELNNNFD